MVTFIDHVILSFGQGDVCYSSKFILKTQLLSLILVASLFDGYGFHGLLWHKIFSYYKSFILIPKFVNKRIKRPTRKILDQQLYEYKRNRCPIKGWRKIDNLTKTVALINLIGWLQKLMNKNKFIPYSIQFDALTLG